MRFNTIAGRQRQAGRAALTLLLLVIGVAIGAVLWLRVGRSRVLTSFPVPVQRSLSASTARVLQGLESPVKIHFFSLLDSNTVPESTRAFSKRVDSLLSEYEAASPKITVERFTDFTDQAARSASADGIKPFNIEKGDACFFGIALSSEGRKETIPQLSPEWEPALEADLTRAIARVATPSGTTNTPAVAAQVSEATVQEVKSALPNIESISVEDGTKILRERALSEFRAAAKEMESRTQEAQTKVTAAQQSGSEAERQAAVQELHRIQAEQTQKMKEIASRLQDEIAALEQLKKKK